MVKIKYYVAEIRISPLCIKEGINGNRCISSLHLITENQLNVMQA